MSIRTEVNNFGEDYTAFYISPNFTVGTDGEPENQRQVSIVIRMNSTEEYEDIDRDTLIDVLVVPAKLNDYTLNTLQEDYEGGDFNDPLMIAEACTSYGFYAHVTDFAMSISFDGTSLKDAWEGDDWDATIAWIETYGEKLARAVGGMIGFGLDRQQNQIGETGWDWLMPLMYDDYESETMFIHRGRS